MLDTEVWAVTQSRPLLFWKHRKANTSKQLAQEILHPIVPDGAVATAGVEVVMRNIDARPAARAPRAAACKGHAELQSQRQLHVNVAEGKFGAGRRSNQKST